MHFEEISEYNLGKPCGKSTSYSFIYGKGIWISNKLYDDDGKTVAHASVE